LLDGTVPKMLRPPLCCIVRPIGWSPDCIDGDWRCRNGHRNCHGRWRLVPASEMQVLLGLPVQHQRALVMASFPVVLSQPSVPVSQEEVNLWTELAIAQGTDKAHQSPGTGDVPAKLPRRELRHVHARSAIVRPTLRSAARLVRSPASSAASHCSAARYRPPSPNLTKSLIPCAATATRGAPVNEPPRMPRQGRSGSRRHRRLRPTEAGGHR
jgi:hypothetical protein